MSEPQHCNGDDLVQIAQNLSAQNINTEDDAIAFCLNHHEENLRAKAFVRLQDKYCDILRAYIEFRFPEICATAKDMLTDMTFDRIWKASSTRKVCFRTKNGSLGTFVNLMCEWAGARVLKKERRRYDLLVNNYKDAWFVQRDEADAYRGDEITDSDVTELMNALQQSFDIGEYPNMSLILRALSSNFLDSNGLQVEGCPCNPSVAGIQNYLEHHGVHMTNYEIGRQLKILRTKAENVLEKQGWELTLFSKHARKE